VSVQRGFGVVGIIIAVEVLAICGHLAMPVVRDCGMRLRAAQVVQELQIVRTAAQEAAARRGQWPEDGVPGRAPSSLVPFLPPGFTFERDGYRFDWDCWPLGDGAAGSRFAAVSVVAEDARLVSVVVQLLGAERPHFTIGNRTTLALSDPVAPSR
jgi:hypothetical protein